MNKGKSEAHDPSLPAISIVVPTYNRAAILLDCLSSFENLNYPRDRFEVIVVNDGSSDNTAEVLELFARSTRLSLTYLTRPHEGHAKTMNSGLARASGEFVAFTDDDCTADPNWLLGLMRAFTDSSIGGVGGPIRARSTGILSDYAEFHAILSSNPDGYQMPPFLITGNACYRRALVEQVGGFHVRTAGWGGADIDLSWRVTATGARLRAAPDAVIFHLHRTRILDFVSAMHRYGNGNFYLATRHQAYAPQDPIAGARRTISPRYFAFRARSYRRRQGYHWSRCLTFACLDVIKDLAFAAGYRSGRVQLRDSVPR